jgi:hypothetical protein
LSLSASDIVDEVYIYQYKSKDELYRVFKYRVYVLELANVEW